MFSTVIPQSASTTPPLQCDTPAQRAVLTPRCSAKMRPARAEAAQTPTPVLTQERRDSRGGASKIRHHPGRLATRAQMPTPPCGRPLHATMRQALSTGRAQPSAGTTRWAAGPGRSPEGDCGLAKESLCDKQGGPACRQQGVRLQLPTGWQGGQARPGRLPRTNHGGAAVPGERTTRSGPTGLRGPGAVDSQAGPHQFSALALNSAFSKGSFLVYPLQMTLAQPAVCLPRAVL